ncbi:PucR family transcriptional regulator [Shouchella patagoniensis]|uniref:PucR family transcriptional regulator n=1 Tax=Shouchella patagoniensis TaxID=228576 RepID=UPI0009959BFD|nr:PucR family transcriptional regulator [Shouchella patagoniensis]
MTIDELLKLPVFEGANLVAGGVRQNKRIENVNMMDAPDIIDYLKADDLLVTTAYHYRDEPIQLLELIKAMHQKGCAGIGLKKRFLGSIPEEVDTFANTVGFPIIALPEGVGLGSIVNQSLSAILDLRTSELKMALETHQTFSKHIMSGKGLPHLLENVAELVGYPVMLMDERCQLIHSSNPPSPVLNGLEYLYRMGYSIFPDGSPFTSLTFLMREPKTITAFPIFTDKSKRGALIVLGGMSDSDTKEILTVEQATNVIAFELMKENALKQYTRRAKNEFFIHFINGEFSSKAETINRAKEFGLDNNRTYKCIVGRLDRDENLLGFKDSQIEMEKVFDYVEEELSIFPFRSHVFIKGELCFILIEGESIDTETDSSSSIQLALELIQENVFRQFKRTVSFGISNICYEFWEVLEAHGEAINALNSGRLSGNRQFVQAYQAKDLSKLLRMIPADDLIEFCEYTLQKLSEPNVSELGLVQTLAVYLETHCQISETAKRLYVHRNTIIYRLEKIEELLGKKLKDPDTTLHLRLALRIQHTLQTT